MELTPSYVYVIAKIEDRKFVAPVKVGITDNPRSRLKTISTSSPFPVGLVHTLHVPLRGMAREMEGAFHHTQAEHRLNGEWFDLTPKMALLILILQFDWHLQLNGVDEELAALAREKSGAGSKADAALDLLSAQEASES